ncbi:TUG ubiquitin-like domain-containing protein [Phthorimaea operculella]|nr:TUG ubiquitin-like domain-containing protein [Phthorimaea operculella]
MEKSETTDKTIAAFHANNAMWYSENNLLPAKMSTVSKALSKDIIVLTPNGRRQKVHCSPDTTILQVLEDACAKHGFEATQYDLKHHNHILDLSTTLRFSNLPNKATLEMVEAERTRNESNVTIGLLLEDGDRRTADFPPNTSLYDLVTSLAESELNSLQNPTVMYMRQEVTGLNAMKEKTLRQLGLMSGRAILRLLNKADEAKQANVSAVYRVPLPENKVESVTNEHPKQEDLTKSGPSTSKKMDTTHIDPLKLIKDVKQSQSKQKETKESPENIPVKTPESVPAEVPMEVDSKPDEQPTSTGRFQPLTQENLERRLKIEEEVTFLGAQKAIAFKQPEEKQDETMDLSDDFYDLTVDEVRRLYRDLQQQRMEVENSPLLTAEKRDEISKQTSEQKMAGYKHAVVRIQFPDRIILQGVFLPTSTIADVHNFIKEHLDNPNRPFHIFTTPLKESLDPKMTLLEAKFVPCVHMHFKWADDDASTTTLKYLKDEIYTKQTSSDAASILASKYRAPSRRKMDDSSESGRSNASSASTAKTSKLPKWFKR